MSLAAANFRDVYRRYGPEVYRFALYLSGDPARAEDLTAEAFLRLWASPVPAHLGTVKSYLLSIVRNLHVETWRGTRREIPLEELTVAASDLPDRTLDGKTELDRVLEALRDLDPIERAAVLLRGEHQLPYEEIARLLEITPANARVKVHRARQTLMRFRKGVVKK